jgi:hypothetical protein
MSSLCFGLDVICVLEARALKFEAVYTSTAAPIFSVREVPCPTHKDSSLKYADYIKPKIRYTYKTSQDIRSSYKTSQIQNVPNNYKPFQIQKRSKYKISQASKRPNPKTFQIQKVLAIKRPKPQNVPNAL